MPSMAWIQSSNNRTEKILKELREAAVLVPTSAYQHSLSCKKKFPITGLVAMYYIAQDQKIATDKAIAELRQLVDKADGTVQ